ncbi:MAG: hypothetical protein A2736_00670 [Candidatus Yanofskybacteria bacterium RIFCSPHIGHO2_01_FULL_41_27]|uniref:Protease PrsW n=2 Tax=Candidatus Yanofskyibacteriota TaxID=1752733 RepID=A0A0G1AI52_9BACT|nr:MAG: hypothetical protein UU84_C0050G0010 [Candidatus Yanofskybacteria bacterium GW2011_GWC2_41_9]OGM99566.1 MAG: hypothetical protein A2736_00670 [Candidatus Yanofskybacteria bacterium RIFCSPHIGHO2_01_FULL_41_27]OGN09488.1 MAG: hypothetical protein A3C64_01285 [Candidatus Yanofskybacteria bacterium RIFCSPHIGHO2_02_FULL_41_12]OGN20887.1 MAG: hypothetical protein A3B00_00750 [Candidatus Yanofskybacteria bacterium RIFCSPLOWO2_01_FULL_41_33]
MSPILNSAVLVSLGLLPSLLWLSYYLRKDCHPEPKTILTKTFLMGIIISPIAILLQLGFVQLGQIFQSDIFSQNSASFFLWAAFAEEIIKYSAVALIVLRDPAFDEPIDAMIYMITAALGFAAIENILVMFRIIPDGANAALSIWALRATGATLLHALSSALLGYFLAMSWFFQDHKKKLVVIGITMASLFHMSFNVFLSVFENRLTGLIYSTSLLIIMAFLISILFDKIRERHKQTSAGAVLTATPIKRELNFIKK